MLRISLRIVSRSSSGALAAPLYILYCLKLCHFLKLSTHPLEPLNLSSLNKKANPKAFVKRILSVMMRPAWSAVSTHIVRASSIRGKVVFFSRFKPALYDSVSIASQRSFSFKMSLTIPSLTSYSFAKSFCFNTGDEVFFKQISFFCAAVRDFHFFFKGSLLGSFCFFELTFGILMLKKEI